MTEKYIPLSVPNLKGNELLYITKAIKDEWVSTAGPYVTEFENMVAQYVNVSNAVSCQNGTSGIHTCLMLSNIKAGDEVLVPALTFIAAANPVKYINAEPVFIDCDDSLCIDPEKIELFIKTNCIFKNGLLTNKNTKKIIKAIIVVHVFGNMADMEAIMNIASKYSLTVIEDSTEALGSYYSSGKYKGKHAGTIGDFGIYSFNGNKIITTGGGGMIVARDNKDLIRAKHITTQAKQDELYFIHDEIGYNYRMTNLQAAMGIAQLEQLENFIKVKNSNYDLYCDLLKDIQGLRILPFRKDIRSNKWFYSLFCDDTCHLNRDQMIEYLESNRIQSRPIWALIPDQKPYRGSQVFMIEKAKYYIDHVLNLPCSTNLSSSDIERIACVIKKGVE